MMTAVSAATAVGGVYSAAVGRTTRRRNIPTSSTRPPTTPLPLWKHPRCGRYSPRLCVCLFVCFFVFFYSVSVVRSREAVASWRLGLIAEINRCFCFLPVQGWLSGPLREAPL